MNSRSLVVIVLFALVVFVVVPVILSSTFTAVRATQLRQEREIAKYEPPPEAPPPPPAPVPTEPEVLPTLRPVDDAAMAVMETPMDAPIIADSTPGQPYRIQLERGANGASASKLHVDLDRDGKFDEVWTLGSPMRRDVSPSDDGNLTEHTVWTDRGWAPAAP